MKIDQDVANSLRHKKNTPERKQNDDCPEQEIPGKDRTMRIMPFSPENLDKCINPKRW